MVKEVRISSKGVAQTKNLPGEKRVPNFGFVVFEEESAVVEVLRFSKLENIKLNGTHRLNVEEKKTNTTKVKDRSKNQFSSDPFE